MKGLIVYYSHTGNNEKLALELQKRIGFDIYKINEVKKRKTISILLDFMGNRSTKLINDNKNFSQYDYTILVSPVWGGKIASPMRTFLEKEKSNLKKFFYITLCNGAADQRQKLIEELSFIVQRNAEKVIELSINELLPEDQKNKIKHTFHFQASNQDIEHFDDEIDTLVQSLS